jgi:hypothetical protein
MPDKSSFSDLHEQYQKEVTPEGPALDEARAVQEGMQVMPGQPWRTEQHHIFCQARRDRFEAVGIDIDRYVVDLDRDNHQDTVHTREVPGNRNPDWDAFFSEHEAQGRQPTRKEMLAFARGLMEKNGWDHHVLHVYNDPSRQTNLAELDIVRRSPPYAGSAPGAPAAQQGDKEKQVDRDREQQRARDESQGKEREALQAKAEQADRERQRELAVEQVRMRERQENEAREKQRAQEEARKQEQKEQALRQVRQEAAAKRQEDDKRQEQERQEAERRREEARKQVRAQEAGQTVAAQPAPAQQQDQHEHARQRGHDRCR